MHVTLKAGVNDAPFSFIGPPSATIYVMHGFAIFFFKQKISVAIRFIMLNLVNAQRS